MTAAMPAAPDCLKKNVGGSLIVFEFCAIVARLSTVPQTDWQAVFDAVYEQNDK